MPIEVSGPLFNNPDIAQDCQVAIDRTLEFGLRIVQEATPVITGALKQGWYVQHSQHAITNSEPYCVYVENGTSRFEGRHMVGRNIGIIQEKLSEQLSSAMRSYQ
jgi:hypothetical protein